MYVYIYTHVYVYKYYGQPNMPMMNVNMSIIEYGSYMYIYI